MELSNHHMWMKFTCTHLPNKVATCPNKTWHKSPVSGTVHNRGRLLSPAGYLPPGGLDWGLHELGKMVCLSKFHQILQ